MTMNEGTERQAIPPAEKVKSSISENKGIVNNETNLTLGTRL